MSTFVNFNIIDEKLFLWLFLKIQRTFLIFRLEWNIVFILFNVLIVFFSHFSSWLRTSFTRISYIIIALIWRFKFVLSQNIFPLFFIVSQCFAWLLNVDFEHDNFFKITSCCQYILSRTLFRVDISCFFYYFFRRHSLCHLNFFLFDHFDCYFQFFFWRKCWRFFRVDVKFYHRDISSRDCRSSIAFLLICFLLFCDLFQSCRHLF